MNRQLSKTQKSLEKMMGKKNLRMASNVTAVVLILLAVLLVPHLQLNALSWLDHVAARVVLMVVIVLVCLLDPVVALLLAILFVVCLQRLHKLKKERNAQVVLNALNTVVKNNKLNELNNIVNEVKNNNVSEEELVEDELPTVEDQTNVLPPNNGDNSNVVLAEVNPANMKQEVEYNVTPNNIENVVNVNVAEVADNAAAGNANQVGALLEEGSENVLSANNTEHFLSVENAAGNQNNVLTARIVCRKSGFEKDSELVNQGRNVNNKDCGCGNCENGDCANCEKCKNKNVNNQRPSCKPFTTPDQFKDAQSNLVKCQENNRALGTQGHGNLKNVPVGTYV